MRREGHILIQLHDTIVEAGGRLRGRIVVDVTTEITHHELLLAVVGNEVTEITYEERTNRRTRTCATTSDGRVILMLTVPVEQDSFFQKGRSIPSGLYEVSFDTILPKNIPASMWFQQGGGSCKIEYKVNVTLRDSREVKMHCTELIYVKAFPKVEMRIPFLTHPNNQRVRFWNLLDQGGISFVAKLSNTQLQRGSSTLISVACCKEAMVCIKSIESTLVENINWTSSSYSSSYSRKLDRVDLAKNSGIIVGRRNVGTSEKTLEEMYDCILNHVNAGMLSVPLRANTTYVGSTITVEHGVMVKIITHFGVRTPTIWIPCRIEEQSRFEMTTVPTPLPLFHFNHAAPESTVSIASTAAINNDGTETRETILSSTVPPELITVRSNITEQPPLQYVFGVTNIPVCDIQKLSGHIAEPNFAASASSLHQTSEKPVPNLQKLDNQSTQYTARTLDIVEKLLAEPEWDSFFQFLSPEGFSKILGSIKPDYDQSKVAVLLASRIATFTCDHAVLGLRSVSDRNRIVVTEQLIPFCYDLEINKKKIQNELTVWERIATSISCSKNDPGIAIAEEEPQPLIPPPLFDSYPSVSGLLKDMEIEGVEILEKRVVDPSWEPLFTALPHYEYYSILRGVASGFDQVKVAVLLARSVAVFSCDHVVCALQAVAWWNRRSIIEHLIPLCNDFPNNHRRIHDELTEWSA